MLLGWPDVEIAGITTTHEEGGRRAGFVHEVLRRGALGHLCRRRCRALDDDVEAARRLPRRRALFGPPDRAETCASGRCARSARAQHSARRDRSPRFGPFTNLGLCEIARPGVLDTVPVVVMGGGYRRPGAGYPQWPEEYDWNVQCDTRAAEIVSDLAQLTIVPWPRP